MSVLKIDLDLFGYYTPKPLILYFAFSRLISFGNWLNVFSRTFTVRKLEVYNTNKGLHIYITIAEKLTDIEIALIRSTIDDHVRALFNALRVTGWEFGAFNILFRVKSFIYPQGIKRLHCEKRNKLLERFFKKFIFHKHLKAHGKVLKHKNKAL